MPTRFIIAIGGPPNSGKSTFMVSLVYALQDQRIDATFADLDLWSSTVYLIRSKMTKNERDQLKRKKVTVEQVNDAKRSLKRASLKHQVVVADGPGVISDELRTMFAGATHGIIVCREEMQEEVEHWTKFFSEVKIELVALVTSRMEGDEGVESNGLIKAVIVKLERKRRDSPAMKQFAALLRSKLGIEAG